MPTYADGTRLPGSLALRPVKITLNESVDSVTWLLDPDVLSVLF